jgi:hypothetical protein
MHVYMYVCYYLSRGYIVYILIYVWIDIVFCHETSCFLGYLMDSELQKEHRIFYCKNGS